VDETTAKVIMFVSIIISLTILALGYWMILHQDGTILTILSSVFGGLFGYIFKSLKVSKSEDDKGGG